MWSLCRSSVPCESVVGLGSGNVVYVTALPSSPARRWVAIGHPAIVSEAPMLAQKVLVIGLCDSR